MLVEHTLTVIAKCPVNSGNDVYEIIVRTDKLIQVEALQEHAGTYRDMEIFQEDLTADFAAYFFCEVESVGYHGKVKTRVVCDARTGERVHENGAATRNGRTKKSRRTADASEQKQHGKRAGARSAVGG